MTDENGDLIPAEELLRREQPLPSSRFRGELGRWIALEHAPGRPPRLGLLVGGCVALGLLLLVIAALSF